MLTGGRDECHRTSIEQADSSTPLKKCLLLLFHFFAFYSPLDPYSLILFLSLSQHHLRLAMLFNKIFLELALNSVFSTIIVSHFVFTGLGMPFEYCI